MDCRSKPKGPQAERYVCLWCGLEQPARPPENRCARCGLLPGECGKKASERIRMLRRQGKL